MLESGSCATFSCNERAFFAEDREAAVDTRRAFGDFEGDLSAFLDRGVLPALTVVFDEAVSTLVDARLPLLAKAIVQ